MRVKFIASADCAIQYDDQFLIIERPKGKHAGGLLSFPGGTCEVTDAGENEQDALVNTVKREIFEELGLDINEKIHLLST